MTIEMPRRVRLLKHQCDRFYELIEASVDVWETNDLPSIHEDQAYMRAEHSTYVQVDSMKVTYVERVAQFPVYP